MESKPPDPPTPVAHTEDDWRGGIENGSLLLCLSVAPTGVCVVLFIYYDYQSYMILCVQCSV